MTTPFIQKRNIEQLLSSKLPLSSRQGQVPLVEEEQQKSSLLSVLQDRLKPTYQAPAITKPATDSILPQATTTARNTTDNQPHYDRLASIKSLRPPEQRRAAVNTNTTGITASQGSYSGADAQLADYARKAGFPESEIPTAIAVMKAESGGNPTAINTANRNGSTDTGIFQINSIHSNWTKSLNLKDPYQNAQAAFKIWKDAGRNWTPWSAYNNGSYQKFLQEKQFLQPVNLPPATATTGLGTLRQVLVKAAQRVIGIPYVWGGNSLTTGVDCSGLVQQVYKQLGIKTPRTADQLSTFGKRTTIQNLKPGDLVAWQGGWRGPEYVGHIAIYAGNGQIIEAATQGVPVRQRAIRPNESVFGVALSFNGG